MNIQLAKKVAKECVLEAGELIKKYKNNIKKVSFKDKSDIVTDVDIKSEKLIIDKIQKNFPEHNILSEERGLIKRNKSEYTWIIDPIDGTINFYHDAAPFRVGVCLTKNDVPIITALSNPVKNQLFFAEKGKGATLNHKKLLVNDNSHIKFSVVMTHLSSKKSARMKTISVLDNIFCHSLHIRLYGSGLASLSYIAMGEFDVYFNVQTSIWDILPGSLLVTEAGGTVTDIEGNPLTLKSTSILATNGKVHKTMLKLLKSIN
ncbi:MAG: inositol monophosphatase family protein [archaeon]